MSIAFIAILVSTSAYAMSRKSHFFSGVDVLAPNIRPTIWQVGGDTAVTNDESRRIRQMIDNELENKLKRFFLWLSQNPLAIALPGHNYNEFMELDLTDRPQRSTVHLRGLRNATDCLKAKQDNQGRIFAMADEDRGYVLLVRRGSRSMVGTFSIEEGTPKRSLHLRKIILEEEGQAPGWRLIGRFDYI